MIVLIQVSYLFTDVYKEFFFFSHGPVSLFANTRKKEKKEV